MNSLMTGLYVGKALAEGDYLSAAPFFADIVKAVKIAVPNLIKQTASSQLAKVQNKLGILPPNSGGPVETQAVVAVPVQPAPSASRWLVPAAAILGGYFLIKRMRRR